MDLNIFGLIILPILIFFGRVADVSLGTLRIIFISQGKRTLAPLVGFFEVFIWLLAAGQIFSNLTNFIYYIAYAGGFAIGNYVGLVVENKISLGLLSLNLIVRENPEGLINELNKTGYGITSLTAEGAKGIVKLLVLVIKRKNLPNVLKIIRENNPKAFISIENVQSVKGGIFPKKSKTRWELFRRKKIV
ncbi:MAG: conserved membrane protein of unknown function [Promethearchaeota archaeon]|nr:MAG: conserved membrane protein of unknown function [Candidatus Lokiarchaeota archaeon]